MDRCDATTVTSVLLNVLCHHNIDVDLCQAACFNGASTFQGQSAGVAAKLQQKQPKIRVTHCQMHSASLAVQDTVSAVSIMFNFLQRIMDLVNVFQTVSNQVCSCALCCQKPALPTVSCLIHHSNKQHWHNGSTNNNATCYY